MVLLPVLCPHCQSEQVIKGGKTQVSNQRYKCQNADCLHYPFQLDLTYQGRLPAIKDRIIDMALHGSGIRDIARMLKISPTTVINELKKSVNAQQYRGGREPFVQHFRWRVSDTSLKRSSCSLSDKAGIAMTVESIVESTGCAGCQSLLSSGVSAFQL